MNMKDYPTLYVDTN